MYPSEEDPYLTGASKCEYGGGWYKGRCVVLHIAGIGIMDMKKKNIHLCIVLLKVILMKSYK